MREPEAAQVLLRRWSVAYDFSLRAPRRAAVYVGSSQSSPHAAAGAGARPATLVLSIGYLPLPEEPTKRQKRQK